MFERFDESARHVMVHAQREARELRHQWLGTEHLLLGLLADPDSIASRVLDSFGVTAGLARERVVEVVEPGEEPCGSVMPFTPRVKTVLELALRE